MVTEVSLDNGPTSHLSWKELACKDGTPYPFDFIMDRRVHTLANVFESIRALYNKPIAVVSAFRTIGHNRRIGGAPKSQHLEGKALDLKPPVGISINQFYKDIRANTKKFGICGLGRYKTFVHVDIRNNSNGKLIVWSGTSAKDASTRIV